MTIDRTRQVVRSGPTVVARCTARRTTAAGGRELRAFTPAIGPVRRGAARRALRRYRTLRRSASGTREAHLSRRSHRDGESFGTPSALELTEYRFVCIKRMTDPEL
jgi:hypothetical protein